MTEREVLQADLLHLLVRLSAATIVGFLCLRYVSKIADPSYWETEKAKKMTKVLFAKLGIKNTKQMELSGHELRVAANLVVPNEMNVSFKDIGGYEDITCKLLRRVIQPIMKKDSCFKSSLASPPKGVLLYGPPGCGKTMIAKALAKESGMNFINLNIADVTDKWYGESNKMAVAVFTLATKIAPCIIFIDEIDCFLSVRGSSDHEATAMMKSIFMSAWDGLITDKEATVIIIGATNRISSVDPAILRRMPARFHVDLPDLRQREEVLKIILRDELVDKDVPRDLAEISEGLSCADLTEVCRTAIVERMNDFMEHGELAGADQKVHIETAYFIRAMSEVCQSRNVRSFISLD